MHDRGIECNYDLCACVVIGSAVSGEAYCSHFCKEATQSSLEAEACACGHPPCDEP
jgi:hypothetical protein